MQPALHHYLNGRIALYLGDLTEHAVDAIVNAANRSLLGGSGVDGAIHRRGGPAILEACRALRRDRWPDGLPTGQVAITPGGKLAAPFVIHTVGPIYGQHHGEEAALLAACYRNAIELATNHALKSLAFPAISTGVYGYPPEQAAIVVSTTLSQVLADTPMIDEVRLVFSLANNWKHSSPTSVFRFKAARPLAHKRPCGIIQPSARSGNRAARLQFSGDSP